MQHPLPAVAAGGGAAWLRAPLLLQGQALCLVLNAACRRQTAQKFVRALLRLYERSACKRVWMLGASVRRARVFATRSFEMLVPLNTLE